MSFHFTAPPRRLSRTETCHIRWAVLAPPLEFSLAIGRIDSGGVGARTDLQHQADRLDVAWPRTRVWTYQMTRVKRRRPGTTERRQLFPQQRMCLLPTVTAG
jgi:hypothetical protein